MSSVDKFVISKSYNKIKDLPKESLSKLKSLLAKEIVIRELNIRAMTKDELDVMYATVKTLIKRSKV
jgi:hypothetical protein